MPALLALFGWGKIAGQAVAGWLSRRSPAEIGCIALALFAGLQTLRYHAEKRHSAKLEVQLTHCSAARHADEQNWLAAAEAARKADAANKARVEAEQAKISQEKSDEYEARLAAARALADRLRRELAQANSGGSPAAPVSSLPAAPGGPPQSPDNGFSIDDRLVCTAQGIQLDELIKWVREQHAIKP